MTPRRILTLNAGSSSLKFAVYRQADLRVLSGQVPSWRRPRLEARRSHLFADDLPEADLAPS